MNQVWWEWARETAGAVFVERCTVHHADWILELMFEWEGYRQVVRSDFNSAMSQDEIAQRLALMRPHAIHLIQLYQMPETTD